MAFDQKTYHAEWAKENKGKMIAYRAKWWAKEGPEWYRIYMQTDKYKDDKLRQRLKRRYGITLEEYNAMLEAQNGVCYICGNPPKENDRLCVDHGEQGIRKLLCRGCNLGLGYLKHSSDLLRKAATYLEKFI